MKPLAWTPADAEPDDGVACLDPGAVDQPLPLDDADAGAREVELAFPVDAGKLRRLAADERDPGLAADLGRALDELRDLLELDPVRRDVVEEEERLGAAGQHVVDAVGRKVGATVAKSAARPGQHELRPDRVRGRGQQPGFVEGMQSGERAEPARTRGLDGRAQALDDGSGLLDRDARLRVGLALARHGSSLRSALG